MHVAEMENKVFHIEALREFSTRIFLHFGVPPEDAEFPSGASLPEMNRSVVETRGQLIAVWAPAEPPRFPPRAACRPRSAQGEGRLFAIDVPDSD